MSETSFWRWIILALVASLVAPVVLAASPAPTSEPPVSTAGQEITDLAIDPTGQFVVAAVNVDPAKLLALPGQAPHRDLYVCDFGLPASTSTGAGCRGVNHRSDYSGTTTGASQALSFAHDSRFGARYGVAGPGTTVSLWAALEDTPRWETNASTGTKVVNVSLSPDLSRLTAAVSPTNPSGSATIQVYNAAGSTGQSPIWRYEVPEPQRPTGLAQARSGGLLAVGTTSGIFFLQPSASGAPTLQQTHPLDTGDASVRHILISRNGEAVVAATSDGVYYVRVAPNGTPEEPRWNRGLGGAQRVALSLDGERFAAASGSKIYFYRRLPTTLVAEQVGDPFDAGTSVADLAYDGTGRLLVAVAGDRAYAFGPDSTTPIWSFDATLSTNGALDGPLRKVVVSEGGERIVIAGKTKLMPYRSRVSATAAFLQEDRLDVQPGQTQRFSLRVTNTGSMTDNYTFISRFPTGWNGQGPDPVTLAPDQSTTVSLSVDVPAGKDPGTYGFDVQVRSRFLLDRGASNPVVASPGINFTIPRAVVLNVTTAEDRVPSLRAGGEQTILVTVRNRGNAEGVVNMTAEQSLSRGSSWSIRFAQPQVRIPGGGETTMSMVIAAPEDAASGDRNEITIVAREGPAGGAEARKVVTAYVDPKFGAELTDASGNGTYEFGPGELKSIRVRILNTGNTDDRFNVTTSLAPASVTNDWRVTLGTTSVSIPRGESREVVVSVRPGVSDPRDASLVVKAASHGSGESESGAVTISLASRAPETTSSRNPLPAPGLALVLPLAGLAALLLRRRGGRA